MTFFLDHINIYAINLFCTFSNDFLDKLSFGNENLWLVIKNSNVLMSKLELAEGYYQKRLPILICLPNFLLH